MRRNNIIVICCSLLALLGGGAWAWVHFHGGHGVEKRADVLPPLKLRWSQRLKNAGPIPGGATIDGSSVYVADRNGNLYALDLANGRPRWIYTNPDGFESKPLVWENLVIIGDTGAVDTGATVHAVAADSGNPIWTYHMWAGTHCTVGVSGQTALLGDDEGDIYALDARTGDKLWMGQALDRINSAPAIGPGDTPLAYFAGCDFFIRALDVRDGQQRFAVNVEAVCPGSPVLAGERLIVGTGRGRVLCLDNADGRQLWEYNGVGKENMVYSSPAIADGLVVVGGARDGEVRCLELANGHEKWAFATRDDVDSSPAIDSGHVYVGSKDRNFYVLDLHSGAKIRSFAADHSFEASPAIAAGVVIIGDMHGTVYCFELVK